MKSKKLFIASLDTRNFMFEAFSQTSAEAARADLLEGLKIHGREYRLPANWYEQFLTSDGFVERFVEIGRAYRDRELLIAK